MTRLLLRRLATVARKVEALVLTVGLAVTE
jgi:hypothetical protein